MQRSKVCQGVKCVEQSKLGCKVFQGAKSFGEQSVHQPLSAEVLIFHYCLTDKKVATVYRV